MPGHRLVAVPLGHRPPQLRRDGERLARQHRGLIGDAHTDEIAIRVEPRGHSSVEQAQEPLAAPHALDERAHLARLGHVPHHEIPAARVAGDLAARRLGLLVIVLAMDDGGEPVFGIRLDALPHVEHRAARRVHQHATDGAQPLEVLDGDAERREQHDVGGGDAREVELGAFGPVQEVDTHSPQLGVDVGIVDDFADQEQPAVGELGAGLIGVLDGAVHTVAEAELARELERQITERERVPLGADPIHHPAVVVGHQRAFDVALEAEAAPEIGLLHGVNLTGRLGRRARRPSHAARPNRRGRWRPLPCRAALPARRRDPA